MCTYQKPYTCTGAQKANTCGTNSSKSPNRSTYFPKTCSDSGVCTAASSEDGNSDTTSDTVTSPISEKPSFIKPPTGKYYSGCGGR